MADFGETVLLNCVATLDDGTVAIDTKTAGSPLAVKIGSQVLPAAVEVAASNLLPGGAAHLSLTPAQAFGEYDETLVLRFPASVLPGDRPFEEGARILLKTAAGEVDARVVEADEGEVVVDLNHPFAGKSVDFDIELVSLVHETAIHRELHPAGCACGCDKLKAQIG